MLLAMDDMVVDRWDATGVSRPVGRADFTPFSTSGLIVIETEGGLISRQLNCYDQSDLFN